MEKFTFEETEKFNDTAKYSATGAETEIYDTGIDKQVAEQENSLIKNTDIGHAALNKHARENPMLVAKALENAEESYIEEFGDTILALRQHTKYQKEKLRELDNQIEKIKATKDNLEEQLSVKIGLQGESDKTHNPTIDNNRMRRLSGLKAELKNLESEYDALADLSERIENKLDVLRLTKLDQMYNNGPTPSEN